MARSPQSSDFVIKSDDLRRVSRELDRIGRTDLRRHLTQAVREAGDAAVPLFRQSALGVLPHRGGLGRHVSESRFSVDVRDTAVQVQAQSDVDLGALNRGRARHPVFGNRKVWVNQLVRPGWWTAAAERARPLTRQRIDAALARIKHELDRA